MISLLLMTGASAMRGFTTRWTVSGDATDRTITLPLVQSRTEGALAYDFTVRWGDGTYSKVTAYNDANRIHTYAANGTYDVTIIGTCEGWSFNDAGDKLKIVGIMTWGSRRGFAGFKYLAGGFYGCTNLTRPLPANEAIPASGTGCLSQGFENTFCESGLTGSIPSVLFSAHTLVATFAYTFFNCSGLTGSIPSFSANTLVKTFEATFFNCSGLTGSIPSFSANTLVTIFAYTFSDCSGLTGSIPSFSANTLVTNYNYTFYGCSGLTIPQNVFCEAGNEGTRFLNMSVGFTNCFYRASATGPQGTAPTLWTYDYGTGTPTNTTCFGGAGNNATSLSNYADIPAEWK